VFARLIARQEAVEKGKVFHGRELVLRFLAWQEAVEEVEAFHDYEGKFVC
jgi:hypothetical protein